MSEKQMRKMISYKIENLSPKERAIVDEWANGQFNIQQSLTNIIMHIVGFIGNSDVMDFDVQKRLHLTLGNSIPEQSNVKIDDNEGSMDLLKPRRRNDRDDFPNVGDLFPDE